MAVLYIRLFGAPSITTNEGSEADLHSDKARALLAYLAVESSQMHRREKLVGLLWPDYTESSARANLRRALSDLRMAIGDQQAYPPYLHISWETLQFNIASQAAVDVLIFNLLVQLKLPGSQASEPNAGIPASIDRLEEAVALYRGSFLEGFSIPDCAAFEEWTLLTRERYHRQVVQALYHLANVYQERGEYERALPHAWRQVEMDPWQERGQRQLIQLLALSGQREAALGQYEVCRQLLHTELGATPSKQTYELYSLLKSGDWPPPALVQSLQAGRIAQECPYRGLAVFGEQDAPFFFGREAFIDRLVEAIHQTTGVNLVIGPSGSGKSSVVFAGLLPKLRARGDWLVAAFRPGRQPFQSLAAALAPLIEPGLTETDLMIKAMNLAQAIAEREISLSSILAPVLEKHRDVRHLLLVVDQFEELYTLCQEADVRILFLDLLFATCRDYPRNSLKLLFTLRADFIGQAMSYHPFTDLLQVGALMLGPMTRDELCRVVQFPANRQGVSFEPGLVERILDDVGYEPGNLPLLQFSLLLLWEKQVNGCLTHTAYDAIEKVEGALASYTEQVYGELDQADQVKMQKVFTQLVRPGEGTEDTRRQAARLEIGEANWRLVQLLADRRLLVTNRDASTGSETAEVAHEAIIQKWQRLRDWMNADRAFRYWQENLRVSVRQWQASGRDEGSLLRGTSLSHAESWMVERSSELSEHEIDFIRASIEQKGLQEKEKADQYARERIVERRARRLLGALAGVLALAAIIAIVLSVYSLQQRRQALLAYSLSMAANAQNALADRDLSAGLELAIKANQMDRPPEEAQRILREAAFLPGARWHFNIREQFPGIQGAAVSLDISPDGQKALSGFDDGYILLWEIANQAEILRLAVHTGKVNEVAFSPDGLQALSGGEDGQVILWDLTSGAVIKKLTGHSGSVRTVDFSPDGRLAVSGGFGPTGMLAPGELILWDLSTGREVRRFSAHLSGIVAAKFTPDGLSILSSSGDANTFSEQLSDAPLVIGSAPFDLILWNIENGDIIHSFEGSTDDAYSLDISPDGARAMAGSYYNKLANLWDLKTGQLLTVFEGHSEGVSAVAFTPDGQSAVTGSFDNSLGLWDLETGQLAASLAAHKSDVLDIGISPDGRTALSSAKDGGVTLWDLVDADLIQTLSGHGDMVYDTAFTPDGKFALSSSGSPAPSAPVNDASIRLWDLKTGRQIQFQPLSANVIFQVAISPDGKTALIASDWPEIILWDLPSWREIGRLVGHPAAVTAVEFIPGSQQAISLGIDGSLIHWDVGQRQPIRRMQLPAEGVWSLAVSPDGRRVLTDATDSSMILWDLGTGKPVRNFKREDSPVDGGNSGMVFLPGGDRAISCEPDGYLIEWNLDTGDEIRRLGQHASLRTRIAINQDGSLAMTSGMDGSLMLWDLTIGELVRRSSGYGVVFDLAANPVGPTLLFGSSDMRVYHWRFNRFTLDELIDWIEDNRYIQSAERDGLGN